MWWWCAHSSCLSLSLCVYVYCLLTNIRTCTLSCVCLSVCVRARSFLVLEAREEAGGTWSYFKYPGVRCDSPIYTFGFSFRPWHGQKKYPEARHIQRYMQETLEEEGIAGRVRYGMRITKAQFDSRAAAHRKWRLTTADGSSFSCGFLYTCAGYYKYDNGYSPDFDGLDAFSRQDEKVAVHAQQWDDSIDYRDKNVAIIGSGATAVTMVPAMVKAGARQVCMIQRSPTYITPLPNTKDAWVGILPYSAIRTRHICQVRTVYTTCKAFPYITRAAMLSKVKGALPKPTKADVPVRSRQEVLDTHFTPSYLPWAQRVCIAPDGDFFQAMHQVGTLEESGDAGSDIAEFRRAIVVTGHIDSFTTRGIKMRAGATASSAPADRSKLVDLPHQGSSDALEIPCDVAVIATGFNMHDNLPASDFRIIVDGNEYDAPKHMIYKSWMLSDVPNLAFCIGYANNSWTIKSELAAQYLCDVLSYMDDKGFDTVVPRFRGDISSVPKEDLVDLLPLSAGYVQRTRERLPKATRKGCWVHNHDDRADRKLYARVGDAYDMKFLDFSTSTHGLHTRALEEKATTKDDDIIHHAACRSNEPATSAQEEKEIPITTTA